MKKLIALTLLLPALTGLSQTVRKVACGEYARYILRADNGKVYEDFWNGHNVSLTPTNTDGKRIVDIAGALYTAVGVDEEGFAWVFGQGNITPVRITKDTTGAPFKGNISCTGYFGTYVTLKADGSIWLWGKDAWMLFSENTATNLARPAKLKLPPGVKFKKIKAGSSLLALATDGAVYEYSAGKKGIPARIALPRPASDIAASHTGFFIAIVPDRAGASMGYPYGWGPESAYFGATGSINQPIPLKALWDINAPIQRITANHNAIHFIDSLGRLFGMGDNPIGDVGNGEELVNHAELYRTPYAWSWTKHEHMVSKPVEIGKGIKWKEIWADNSYAFYHYALDRNDALYFWGRSKSWVSGKSHSNEDLFPNAFDVLKPTLLQPFTTPSHHYGVFSKYTCDAGRSQDINTNTTRLLGHATASTGYHISSLKWSRVSGPDCTIVSPSNASTTVKDLKPGIYRFSLQMTDNNTATISDTVTVTVKH